MLTGPSPADAEPSSALAGTSPGHAEASSALTGPNPGDGGASSIIAGPSTLQAGPAVSEGGSNSGETLAPLSTSQLYIEQV